MEILLAIGAAVAYGASDFTGGALTRRGDVVVVILLSQLVSSALLVVIVASSAEVLSWPGVGWGAAAGVADLLGISLLYQGLAIGRMSVVAPITGVLGAGLPVRYGLAAGERPGPAALTGIVAGLIAVVVITRAPSAPANETGVPARAHRRPAAGGPGHRRGQHRPHRVGLAARCPVRAARRAARTWRGARGR